MTAAHPTPDWLARHGAELQGDAQGLSFVVYFGQVPQYTLNIVPVQGGFGCKVKQTINGRFLGGETAQPTPAEALQAGLEALRQALGW